VVTINWLGILDGELVC